MLFVRPRGAAPNAQCEQLINHAIKVINQLLSGWLGALCGNWHMSCCCPKRLCSPGGGGRAFVNKRIETINACMYNK